MPEFQMKTIPQVHKNNAGSSSRPYAGDLGYELGLVWVELQADPTFASRSLQCTQVCSIRPVRNPPP